MIDNIAVNFSDYELLDSGEFEKLERFGEVVTRRPEPQAIWRKSLSEQEWQRRAHASFLRDGKSEERGEWRLKPSTPEQWCVGYRYKGISLKMRLGLTSFKHVGIFPEQAANWNFIYDSCREIASKRGDGATPPSLLNLFAYTGGASLAAAASGAKVTHVDSVKQVVSWSRENMELSSLSDIRWVVEDALKFVKREVRRGNRYDAIVLDPPAYGRGANGERWILEENIEEMLRLCSELLTKEAGAFVVLNLYSMGLSSTLARTAMHQAFGSPEGEQRGELLMVDSFGKELPLGVYYRYIR
ncbi:MAG: class I SAM-dependent methyltransferase [Rikenellaceae bacterium]